MIEFDDDIVEQLNDHINKIKHSFLFYRQKAKLHKINVLKAARQYLTAEMTKDEFINVIRRNCQYADAFGNSHTKHLIAAVLKETPCRHRSKKGYVGFRKG
ncbi:MAG: hypothetical protein JO149_06930 [Gammaproteobacteria bacterium]|nr:hypothetical protein [Gammaproteobacteria bacterium]